MKRKLILFLILFLFFLLQTAVLPFIPALWAVPNLLLIFVVSIAFMQGTTEGMTTGFLAGLLVDLTYGRIPGFTMVVYMYLGYWNGRYARIYFDEDVKVPLLLVTVSDFVYSIIYYVAYFLLRGRTNFGGYLVGVILPEIVSTLIFTLILYHLIYRINHSMVEVEKKGKQSLWIRD